jgi:hypothetical protein
MVEKPATRNPKTLTALDVCDWDGEEGKQKGTLKL